MTIHSATTRSARIGVAAAMLTCASGTMGCGGAGQVLSGVPTGGTAGTTNPSASGGSAGMTGPHGSGGVGGSFDPAAGGAGGGAAGAGTGAPGGNGGGAAGGVGGKNMTGGGPRPLRVIFFYTPLGTVLESWRPQLSPTGELVLSPILAPLEPFKSRLLVVDGLTNQVAAGQPTSTHESGPPLLLTGRAGATPGTAGGASTDQHLGDVAFSSYPYRSLQLGVQTGTAAGLAISYAVNGVAILADINPLSVHQRLFANAISVPVPPVPSGDPLANDNFPATGRAQIDQLVGAFAYDLVGAATLSWGDVEGRTTFSWLGAQAGDLRYLADHSGTAGAARDQLVGAQTWFAQQLATLLTSLRDTTLGLGNVLDDTLVVWLSETGEASTQSGRNIPVVIVAPPGRGLRTGTLVAAATRSQGDLMATISSVVSNAAASDIPIASPIVELLAGP